MRTPSHFISNAQVSSSVTSFCDDNVASIGAISSGNSAHHLGRHPFVATCTLM